MPSLSYLVLYTTADRLERLRIFYECTGLLFKPEQHGDAGPLHFSAAFEDGAVVELYPGPINDMRLGIVVGSVDAALSTFAEIGVRPDNPPSTPDSRKTAVVRDPDGRRLELIELAPDGQPS